MNRLQDFVASAAGLSEVLDTQTNRIAHLTEVQEHLIADNAMLQRAIEDLDYINLYEIGRDIQEIVPANNKATLLRLRRMRQENPLAKQAAKLTLRFTLGKGIEFTISPDPEAPIGSRVPIAGAEKPVEGSSPEQPENPDQQDRPGVTPTTRPTLPNKKPQGVAEADSTPVARVGATSGRVAPTPPDSQNPQPKPGEDPENPDEQAPEIQDPNAPGGLISDLPDPVVEAWESFWYDPDNERVLTSHKAMKGWLDANYTDGERFFAAFTGPTPPYVKLTYIPLEEIDLTVYHPDNRAVPLYYRRKWNDLVFDGKSGQYVPEEPKEKYYLDYAVTDEQLAAAQDRVKIPGEKLADPNIRIIHTMPNPLTTKRGERGISEFYSSRLWFTVFKEFMEERASINRAASTIAFKRKVKGGAAAVAKFDGKLGNLELGYENEANQGNELRKLTRPQAAGIYTSNESTDIDWMKTDTGAVNAEKDARLLLMSAGSGVGTMLPYFGEGGDANLATAQTMELPMVKSYEDWQEFVNEELRDIAKFVFTTAFTDPVVVQKAMKRLAFHFPPIITQDVVKHMTGWVQMVTSVAPGNKEVQREAIRGALTVMGVQNIDHLMPRIIEEQEIAEAKKEQQRQALMQSLGASGIVPPGAMPDGDKGKGNFPAKPPLGAAGGPNPATARAFKGQPPIRYNGPKPPR